MHLSTLKFLKARKLLIWGCGRGHSALGGGSTWGLLSGCLLGLCVKLGRPCPNPAGLTPLCTGSAPQDWGALLLQFADSQGGFANQQAEGTAHQHSLQLQGDKLYGSGSKGACLAQADEVLQGPMDRMRIGMIPNLSLWCCILQDTTQANLQYHTLLQFFLLSLAPRIMVQYLQQSSYHTPSL